MAIGAERTEDQLKNDWQEVHTVLLISGSSSRRRRRRRRRCVCVVLN